MDSVLDQQTGQPQGGSHLDPRLHPRAQNDDAACDKNGNNINQYEGDQKLSTNRTLVPERMVHSLQQTRSLRRPYERGHGLYADRPLPLNPLSYRRTR
jgi:ABC-type uncharacterized transport system auxiliary subunit